jgi:hypothetical protein
MSTTIFVVMQAHVDHLKGLPMQPQSRSYAATQASSRHLAAIKPSSVFIGLPATKLVALFCQVGFEVRPELFLWCRYL